MNPLNRFGLRRASAPGLPAAPVLATTGAATGSPGAVRAAAPGAPAARPGRGLATAVAAGGLGCGTYTADAAC